MGEQVRVYVDEEGWKMREDEGSALDGAAENSEGASGKLVLLLLLAWATIALGGYYIAIRMIA